MSTYAIGDVHGCARTLARLLQKVDFHPSRDRLWFTGDLVNRGPDSLRVLQYVVSLGTAAQTVLGNHDLHALSLALGVAQPCRGDTLEALLASPMCTGLMRWLRQQPLMMCTDSVGLVHAGLLPMWTTAQARRLAHGPQARLSGPEAVAKQFLAALQKPCTGAWRDDFDAPTQDVVVTKILTYLRVCDATGAAYLQFKGSLTQIPAGLLPWYAVPERRNADTTWICGHWSALGLHLDDNIRALDTGCVWGRQLTALRLEDKTIHEVQAVEQAALKPT